MFGEGGEKWWEDLRTNTVLGEGGEKQWEDLRTNTVFSEGGEKRWEDLHTQVIEHARLFTSYTSLLANPS